MQTTFSSGDDWHPERVQLRRAKGWRMPPDTVKVDRTTKWGNPFVVGQAGAADRREAWELYRGMAHTDAALIAAARAELRGKNLACWCPLPAAVGEPDICHAAVLIEIANAA